MTVSVGRGWCQGHHVQRGGVTRADVIASADANADGTVTLDELRATPPALPAACMGRRDADDVSDLGAFVESLTQRLMVRFRATGGCTAEPASAEP